MGVYGSRGQVSNALLGGWGLQSWDDSCRRTSGWPFIWSPSPFTPPQPPLLALVLDGFQVLLWGVLPCGLC